MTRYSEENDRLDKVPDNVKVMTPSVNLVEMENVLLHRVDRNRYILKNDHVYLLNPLSADLDRSITICEDGRNAVPFSNRLRIGKKSIVLGYFMPIYNNYGHFITDQLPVFFFKKELLQHGYDSVVVIGVQSSLLKSRIRELLDIFTRRQFRVDFLPFADIFATSISLPLGITIHPGIKQPFLADFFRSHRFSCSNKPRWRWRPGKVDAKRLFVSRSDAVDRRLINERELFLRLKEHSFQFVLGSKLTVKEAIKLFTKAEVVVGVCGATLANIAFCRAGTSVINIQNETMAGMWYEDLANILGLEYLQYKGRSISVNHLSDKHTHAIKENGTRDDSDFVIDIDRFMEILPPTLK